MSVIIHLLRACLCKVYMTVLPHVVVFYAIGRAAVSFVLLRLCLFVLSAWGLLYSRCMHVIFYSVAQLAFACECCEPILCVLPECVVVDCSIVLIGVSNHEVWCVRESVWCLCVSASKCVCV